jgi:hypothetical protein
MTDGRRNKMKVKEMIEYLQRFNPDAQIFSKIEYSAYPPRLSFGTKEGCTRENCDSVFIYVAEDVEKEKP